MGLAVDSLTVKYLFTGFIIGILSGLLGVGGGIFLIPVLTVYFGLIQHKAHAVSLAVVLPTAAAGAVIYGFHGDMDLVLGIKLALGGIIGATIGARAMQKIPAAVLKRLFGMLLCLTGVRMLLP
ncbi:MAG: sulfite exporter TauE/SafE family protein [Acidaminococcales bacterium]|jgi:uncharacterized membrane protein YfcA|nr:sulfite exporter TauE/SafE family protein [Acidaminococcales bacterium]